MTETEIQFFSAVEAGNIKRVQSFLKQDPKLIDTKTPDDITCLMVAAQKHHLDLMKLFISKGMDVNQMDARGRAPLLWVSYSLKRKTSPKQEFECIKFLLENGADTQGGEEFLVDENEGSLITPLRLAAGFGTLKVVELLVKHGADVNGKAEKNIPLVSAALNNNPDIAKFLVKKGADVNARYSDGFCPLTAGLDYPEMIKFLLENEASVEEVDRKEDPLLIKALAYCHKVEVIKLLAQYGAKTAVKSKEGETPLEMALKRNLFEIAEFLQDLEK